MGCCCIEHASPIYQNIKLSWIKENSKKFYFNIFFPNNILLSMENKIMMLSTSFKNECQICFFKKNLNTH